MVHHEYCRGNKHGNAVAGIRMMIGAAIGKTLARLDRRNGAALMAKDGG